MSVTESRRERESTYCIYCLQLGKGLEFFFAGPYNCFFAGPYNCFFFAHQKMYEPTSPDFCFPDTDSPRSYPSMAIAKAVVGVMLNDKNLSFKSVDYSGESD